MGNNYKVLDWQPSLTGLKGKDKLGVPEWPPTPVGTNYKASDWKPYPTEVEGKEKLGALYFPPKSVYIAVKRRSQRGS